jgi:CxxC-x17-CxxC domain-containing protein
MYPAVCDECGRDCQVPFEPDGSKPIYCSNCFEKNQRGFEQRRPSFDRQPFDGGRKSDSGQSQNQTNDLLVSINSKLGKILDLLNSTKAKSGQKETREIEVVKPVKRAKKVIKLAEEIAATEEIKE